MGIIVGYHRTSTREQHLDRGIKEITEFCKSHNMKLRRIYTDQQTGKNFNRPNYKTMKNDVLGNGDILVVSELDRLGRNKKEILKELQYYRDNEIRVMFLDIPTTLMDYSSMEDNMVSLIMDTVNNILIELYATLAQSEMERKEKRQKEGIESMKARNEWDKYGRERSIDFDRFCREYNRVVTKEIRPLELAKELGLTKSTFYNYKKYYEERAIAMQAPEYTREEVAESSIHLCSVCRKHVYIADENHPLYSVPFKDKKLYVCNDCKAKIDKSR